MLSTFNFQLSTLFLLMNAMILAAGFGTRLKPLTDKIPKALIEYKGKPMIVYQIDKLKEIGLDEIVINAHHHSEKLISFFQKNKFDIKINIIEEKEILGTGGGIINAKEFLQNDDSVIINTDVITDFNMTEMISFHKIHKPIATILIQKRNTSRYLEFQKNQLIGRANNNSKPENLFAFNGIHIISKEFFEQSYSHGHSDIIDIYLSSVSKGKTILGYDAGISSFLDIGKPENLKL